MDRATGLADSAAQHEVGAEIRDLVPAVGRGERTRSVTLGHREFMLTYKQFGPLGPACLPR